MSTPVTEFDLNDVRELNNTNLAYIEDLSATELVKRLDDISLSRFGDESLLTKARSVLKQNGIVIFKDALDTTICDTAQLAIQKLSGRFSKASELFVEDEDALFQVGSAKLKGFHKLANYGKTVVTVRQGQDQGMVDIFNCDLALASELQAIRALFEHEFVLRVIDSSGLRPHNLNAYINNEVIATRGFHVDSYAEHLKAFIYMTDVWSLDDGPYTYVKESHLESPFRRANQRLCSSLTPATEAPVVDPLKITPVLAARGSLVISDQAGVHRGWPQASGHQRTAAVMKYAL